MIKRKYTASLLLSFFCIAVLVTVPTVHAMNNRTIEDPIRTEAGYISGTMFGNVENPVRIYRGIPYAAPPVGDFRWRTPQPVTPWTGIRESTRFGNSPMQPTNNPLAALAISSPQSEDCLYLNIMTPADNRYAKLPVMVWFHGGGYTAFDGNDPVYNNHHLPEKGVIVVTVNTRLGVLGLFAHEDLKAESAQGVSGNYMFLDMVAALNWVKRNIAAFGGNPNNVTIFGESGGCGKVINLMASPLTTGLFKKAICESGSAGGTDLTTLETRGPEFLQTLGVSTIAEARAKTAAEIMAAEATFETTHTALGGMGGVWDAAVDGYFLTDTPANVFALGQQRPVPFVLGSNLGEVTNSTGMMYFPQMIPYYTVLLQSAENRGIRAYAYIFDQVPANWRAFGADASHAMELPYVFGNVYGDYPYGMTTNFTWWLLGGLGALGTPELTAADIRVSQKMMDMWAQFAKTGNPSIRYLATWPVWKRCSDQYLYISDPLQVKSGFSTVGQ